MRYWVEVLYGALLCTSVQKGWFSAGGISNVTDPVQKHATDDAVYTALFLDKYIRKQVRKLVKLKLLLGSKSGSDAKAKAALRLCILSTLTPSWSIYRPSFLFLSLGTSKHGFKTVISYFVMPQGQPGLSQLPRSLYWPARSNPST